MSERNGSNASPAANGNSMSDMDPGPGVDVIDGATLYLSRFQF